MAKTLNHYSQQIRAMAPDALALDRARELGNLLIEAKAAVTAAGRKWGEWLDSDCSLAARTALRFMAIAKRWDEPAFTEARQARPDLPLREADKVLAASSTRKRAEPEKPDPYNVAMSKLATAQWELTLASEIRQVDQWAGAEIQAAKEALAAVRKALMRSFGEEIATAWASSLEASPRRVELKVGDRCECRVRGGHLAAGTITAVHPAADGDWSAYEWQRDGEATSKGVSWGMPSSANGLDHSIARVL